MKGTRRCEAVERKKVITVFAKDIKQKRCALIIIADGFEETDTIGFLSLLRQAGICVKVVALTNGLVSSIHGVCIMPDLTLTDLNQLSDTMSISAVILPEGRQSLAKLTVDPRVHRLLRQVAAQQGHIVTSGAGMSVLRAAAVQVSEHEKGGDDLEIQVLLRKPTQSPETFARDLIRRLKQSP